MILRQCPITAGLPTRMVKAVFDLACARYLKAAGEAKGFNTEIKGIRNTYCVDECRQTVPAEVEFIEMEELMSVKKCLACGRTITIRGKGMCKKCFQDNNGQLPANSEQPVPFSASSSPEIKEALIILQADRDNQTLAEAARARMETINQLQQELHQEQTKVSGLREHNRRLQDEINGLLAHNQQAASQTETTPFSVNSVAHFIDQACYLLQTTVFDSPEADPRWRPPIMRIFASSGPLEAINCRIDAQLASLMMAKGAPTANAELELAAELVLKIALRNWLAMENAQTMEHAA